MFSIIKLFQFVLFSGRVYVRALIQQTQDTQLSFNISQLLTIMWYLWFQSFNRTETKIEAYSFASQPFTSRVMSIIISITFLSIITTILSYETSHVIVATNSHVKVQTMNSLETQQPMFLVTKKLQFNLINGV